MNSSSTASTLVAQARTIGRSFATLSAGQLMARMMGLVMTIQVTRVLQAEQFGVVVFAMGMLTYVGLINDLGFNSYAPIEAARGHHPIAELASAIIGIRLTLTVVALIAFAVVAQLAPVAANHRLALLLYGLALIVDALDLVWAFHGREIMRPAAIAEIASSFVQTAVALLFVRSPADLILMPLLYLAGRSVAVGILISCFVRRFGLPKARLDLALCRQLVRGSLPMSATSLVSLISHNFDIVLLGFWLGTAATGMYGAAYRVIWVPTLLIVAYYTALRPIIARASVTGLAALEGLIERSSRLTAAASVGVLVGGVMLARPTLELLYGTGYTAASQSLQLLSAALALLILSRTYRIILMAFHQQHRDLLIMALAAAINIGLNVLLIPTYSLSGSALASLASELFILLAGYVVTRKTLRHVPLGRHLWRPALCALPLILFLALTPAWYVLARIALGGLIYGLLIVIVRAVDLKELRYVFGR